MTLRKYLYRIQIEGYENLKRVKKISENLKLSMGLPIDDDSIKVIRYKNPQYSQMGDDK